MEDKEATAAEEEEELARWAEAAGEASSAGTGAPLVEDADDESSRRRVLDDAMAGPSPVTAPDPEDRDHVLMTWTVREPGAVSVLLDANGLFAAGGVEALTMTRLAGTDVWTCTWSVPADWCASYGIAAWRGRGAPPWCGLDGRPARLAIMRAAGPDPRASRTGTSARGTRSP